MCLPKASQSCLASNSFLTRSYEYTSRRYDTSHSSFGDRRRRVADSSVPYGTSLPNDAASTRLHSSLCRYGCVVDAMAHGCKLTCTHKVSCQRIDAQSYPVLRGICNAGTSPVVNPIFVSVVRSSRRRSSGTGTLVPK